MQHKTKEKNTGATLTFKAHVHLKDVSYCIEFCTDGKSGNQNAETVSRQQDKGGLPFFH